MIKIKGKKDEKVVNVKNIEWPGLIYELGISVRSDIETPCRCYSIILLKIFKASLNLQNELFFFLIF